MTQTKKRLFVVKDSRGNMLIGPDGEPMYFRTKQAAKLVRNEEPGRTVGYGPDHRKTIEANQRGGNR